LATAEKELAIKKEVLPRAPALTPEAEVDAALALLDDLDRITGDETARAEINPLLQRLGVRIGLTFGSTIKGKKRVVRRLLSGLMTFGDAELPVKPHGPDYVPPPVGDAPAAEVGSPTRRFDASVAGQGNGVDVAPSAGTCTGREGKAARDQQEKLSRGGRKEAGIDASTPIPALPLPERPARPSGNHREGISFTKGSRGDSRLPFVNESAGLRLVQELFPKSLHFPGKRSSGSSSRACTGNAAKRAEHLRCPLGGKNNQFLPRRCFMPRASVPLIPKDPNGPLRVLVIGRISTVHQDKENIEASYRYVQDYLQQIYHGPLHLKHLGEQASGMRTDRATILEAEAEVDTGTWDLVITEDLARLYRNPRFQYVFVQNAVDTDTRVICIGDNLDTADDNWEVSLGAAALRHGLHVPDTRRRVRRTATHAFHRGGMVQRVRYGYRKLTEEEAQSGQHGPKGLRIAKVAECTPVIRSLRERVLRGESYAAVADWLNGQSVPLGRYVTKGQWTGRLVEDLLRAPILSGTRTFRDVVYEPVFKTGRHRRRKNAEGPETEHYPELAHLSVAEHEELLQVMGQRAAAHRHRSGPGHPLYRQPRSRSLWPGQHARCAICGGLMYRYDRDQLKCQNAHERGSRACWNHVQVSATQAQEKILGWLLTYCRQFPGFQKALVEAAWTELEGQRRRSEQAWGALDQQIEDLEKRAANLAKAIALGGQMEALVQQLAEVNQELKVAKKRQAAQTEQQSPALARLGSYREVELNLEVALRAVAKHSYEFGDLMRHVIPAFVVQPVQALDSGQVRPRAKLTVRFATLGAIKGADAAWGPRHGDLQVALNLFDPPLHVRHVERCVAEKTAQPQLSLKQIGVRLGLNVMTVKRALDYARRMKDVGTTDPYQEVTASPTNAARWKSR
jgi:site-specific DNA recombinase